jgi:hypothetical protein
MVDLDDYYAGGYFLIHAGKPDWEQLKTDLLPEKVISLSQCINNRFAVHWGWQPGDRRSLVQFGIPESELEAFITWSQTAVGQEIDVYSVFASTEAARRFIKYFLPDTTDLYLIGVGLPKDLEAKNWREPATGELSGVEKQIEAHLPLERGGSILGFEVISFDYSDFGHSWLCNGIHVDMFQLYGIRPNPYGLIDSPEDARRVYDWIDEDKMQGRRAEPEPYDFWLLVSYPLKTEEDIL